MTRIARDPPLFSPFDVLSADEAAHARRITPGLLESIMRAGPPVMAPGNISDTGQLGTATEMDIKQHQRRIDQMRDAAGNQPVIDMFQQMYERDGYEPEFWQRILGNAPP